MKLVSKVTEIYCIADDFCKEYELELNKKALSLSNPSPNTPKTRNRKGRMSDAEMITILVLFHSNTFRNFKHFYLFYICRELKEEYADKGYISQSLIVHTRHRSISNFIINLLAGIAAYAFCDTKPSINMEFEMEGEREAEVKQLTLF